MSAVEVIVTTHALHRWRERAATYGNAPISEVLAAFRASREVKDITEMPVLAYDREGCRYFHHAPTGVYFVASARDAGKLVIVTVLLPATVKVAERWMDLPATADCEPQHAHVGAEMAWLRDQFHRLDSWLNQCHPIQRRVLGKRKQVIQTRISKIRRAYMGWKRQYGHLEEAS